MIKKTKNYEMFSFRKDNRKDISETHVKNLIQSISSKNMLDMRPIVVNEHMEIMDGQHRFMAARELDVEIYYEIKEDIQPSDIILMNIAKAWGTADYLNFYVQNGYEEYIKFKDFCQEHSINLHLGLAVLMGQKHQGFHEFRHGDYVFPENDYKEIICMCRETINVISRLMGFKSWTGSGKFWKSLIKIFHHPDFIKTRWFQNLEKLITRVGIRATQLEYEKMFVDIYNYGSSVNRISLDRE